MKKILLFLTFLTLLGCITAPKGYYINEPRGDDPELLYFSGPPVMPQTDRLMRTAGFWISRHTHPDGLVLSLKEIEALNEKTRLNSGAVLDLSTFPEELDGRVIKKQIGDVIQGYREGLYYFKDGKTVQDSFFDGIESNINLNSISETVSVQYGLITRYADQRLIPSSDPIFWLKGEYDFDALQNSALDIGSPVLVLHKTQDAEWYYVYGIRSNGWIKSENIVLCSREQMLNFYYSESFMVCIESKNDIFLDKSFTIFCEYARMGVRLPLSVVNTDEGYVAALVPEADETGSFTVKEVYLSMNNCHEGYLPYTPRNMLNQAFKLLNAPYGWGGMYGEQDCSMFLCEIFGTVGILLPRNSFFQSLSGTVIGEFTQESPVKEKMDILLNDAVGGITILYMPGHIMLYLGVYEENPYVIQSLWAYSQTIKRKDTIRVINKTVVSSLAIGEDSFTGSFLKRITKINLIAF